MVSEADRKKAAEVLKKRERAQRDLVEDSRALDDGDLAPEERKKRAATRAERGAVAGFNVKRSG